MNDCLLIYRSRVEIDDLAIGECTIRRCSNSNAARWWQLWFHAVRDTDGQPEWFSVPVQIGNYIENGPGGKTWGLSLPVATQHDVPGTNVWAISPSINALDNRHATAGSHSNQSIWHHTPEIIGVPIDEKWSTGAAP
jgi:hypothetical protein